MTATKFSYQQYQGSLNQEIWARLSSQAKRNDLRLASVQKVLVKIGAILAQCADKLMTTRLEHTNGGKMSHEDMNGLLGLQIDALALLGLIMIFRFEDAK